MNELSPEIASLILFEFGDRRAIACVSKYWNQVMNVTRILKSKERFSDLIRTRNVSVRWIDSAISTALCYRTQKILKWLLTQENDVDFTEVLRDCFNYGWIEIAEIILSSNAFYDHREVSVALKRRTQNF